MCCFKTKTTPNILRGCWGAYLTCMLSDYDDNNDDYDDDIDDASSNHFDIFRVLNLN